MYNMWIAGYIVCAFLKDYIDTSISRVGCNVFIGLLCYNMYDLYGCMVARKNDPML